VISFGRAASCNSRGGNPPLVAPGLALILVRAATPQTEWTGYPLRVGALSSHSRVLRDDPQDRPPRRRAPGRAAPTRTCRPPTCRPPCRRNSTLMARVSHLSSRPALTIRSCREAGATAWGPSRWLHC